MLSGASDNPETTLFGPGPRTDASMISRTEAHFTFLNRSAWACLETARATLDSWFAHIPQEKRKDLRRRFQGSSARHVSALLELVTHEILRAVGTDVRMEPELAGKHPDFAAVYQDIQFLIECTVVHDSDARIGATRVENDIKDIVEATYSGLFDLIFETRQLGKGQPSTRRLPQELEAWASSVSHREALQSLQDGQPFKSWLWSEQGWEVVFYAVPVEAQDCGGAIGVEVSPVEVVTTDINLWNALERKASKYRSPKMPYVIVIGDNTSWPSPESIFKALFGPKRLSIGSESVSTVWSCERFFGSPSNPRNRHVSGILFKQGFRDVWSICDAAQAWQRWQLWHHPWTERPLPKGLFPFASERSVGEDGRFSETKPTCTLNALLSLPDPWPGTDH